MKSFSTIKALVGKTNIVINSQYRFSELHTLVQKASVMENSLLTIKVKECTLTHDELIALCNLGGKYVAFDLTEC